MALSQAYMALLLGLGIACQSQKKATSAPEAINWPKLEAFKDPPKVSWQPKGIRPAHAWPELFPEVNGFRAFHADQRNTNQVNNVYAPMFKQGWVAEPNLYIPEGPSFDEVGNVYVVPLRPPVDIQMVSLDGKTGARRFVIPGKRKGQGGAPLVLKDPDHPGKNIIYYGSYEFLTAVSSDGVVLWDVPTGLKVYSAAKTIDLHNFGVNYQSQSDVLIASMGDGNLVVHDRKTGKALLDRPFQLPGAKASAEQTSAITSLPKAAQDLFNAQLAPLFEAPDSGSSAGGALTDLVAAVFGGGAKVANFFGLDPSTGRFWVASTALDEADGKKDDVSDFGAIFGLDYQAGKITIHCSKSFAGGSASSPSVRADGKRVYFADAFNAVIAIDQDCTEQWKVDVGTQVTGSLAVSDNNGEIFAAGAKDIIKIQDEGATAKVLWKSSTDIFKIPLGILKAGNLNLAGLSSNGLVIQAAAGVEFRGHILPTTVALVFIDRTTGKPLYGAVGREESIAAMTSSSDGAVYLAHSPIRRAIAHAIARRITKPVIGGVGKFEPIRLDLLARDASCAAKYRADNLSDYLSEMPRAAADRDFANIQVLAKQAAKAADDAFVAGDLTEAQRMAFGSALTGLSYDRETLAMLRERLAAACAVVP